MKYVDCKTFVFVSFSFEPIEFGDKIKIDIKAPALVPNHSPSVYENVKISRMSVEPTKTNRQVYENVQIKVAPPVPAPRPRSIIFTTEASTNIEPATEITQIKSVETWLNNSNNNGNNKESSRTSTFERKFRSPVSKPIKNVERSDTLDTENDENDGNLSSSSSENEKVYEPTKFESFAADDDENLDENLGPPELLNMSEAYFNFPWCTTSTGSLPTIGEAEEEFSSLEPHQQLFTFKQVNG